MAQTAVAPKPHKPVFARHETFHLRDGWLAKALHAIAGDPIALHEPDAHHRLGVGVNMLKSIRYWMEATGLARTVDDPKGRARRGGAMELTEIGELVHLHDPYIEDPATLWLAHGLLASQDSLAASWYWTFNLCEAREFTAHQLEGWIYDYACRNAEQAPAQASVRKDVRCLIRTYTRNSEGGGRKGDEDPLGSPMASLGLMTKAGAPDAYRLVSGQRRSLPVEIFLYFLHRFAKNSEEERRVLSFDALRWEPMSPGRLLGLDNEAIRSYIAEASQRYGSAAALEVKTAGLDHVQVDDESPEGFLREHYSRLTG